MPNARARGSDDDRGDGDPRDCAGREAAPVRAGGHTGLALQPVAGAALLAGPFTSTKSAVFVLTFGAALLVLTGLLGGFACLTLVLRITVAAPGNSTCHTLAACGVGLFSAVSARRAHIVFAATLAVADSACDAPGPICADLLGAVHARAAGLTVCVIRASLAPNRGACDALICHQHVPRPARCACSRIANV